jgi:hypothetical protein
LYAIVDNVDCFPCISLHQYEIILTLISISSGYLPNSKNLVNKGIKATYEVLRKGRIHNLSIKCQLDLLDKIVKPILLYGCEIWGLESPDRYNDMTYEPSRFLQSRILQILQI